MAGFEVGWLSRNLSEISIEILIQYAISGACMYDQRHTPSPLKGASFLPSIDPKLHLEVELSQIGVNSILGDVPHSRPTS